MNSSSLVITACRSALSVVESKQREREGSVTVGGRDPISGSLVNEWKVNVASGDSMHVRLHKYA